MKKTIALLLIALLAVSFCFAQGETENAAPEVQEVYFLNFKPEIGDVYTDKIAPAFEAETGIKLKVVTAASGNYASTLKSEMAKHNPPAIYQVNGYIGLAGTNPKEVADLKNTEFYKILADKSMALVQGDKVCAVPYAVEGYGIIYNNAIMEKYFALADKSVAIESADQIRDFDTLKAVVVDMQAHKDELGIEGVFAATSMAAGNQWRWQTHMLNVPIFAEFDEGDYTVGDKVPEITFKYADNFKALWDLYTEYSTTSPKLLGAKSVDDSMAEFALGKCAMVQNGNWGAGQILGTKGCVVQNDDIKFMPIYMGIPGESEKGLCIGTENYLCINGKVSAEQQALADKFLTWLYSSETGKAFVKNDLGFITPFNTFNADEMPSDPLAKEVIRWMNMDNISSVPWAFASIPSEQWKDAFGGKLLTYTQGQEDWNAVVTDAVENWAFEYSLVN